MSSPRKLEQLEHVVADFTARLAAVRPEEAAAVLNLVTRSVAARLKSERSFDQSRSLAVRDALLERARDGGVLLPRTSDDPGDGRRASSRGAEALAILGEPGIYTIITRRSEGEFTWLLSALCLLAGDHALAGRFARAARASEARALETFVLVDGGS